MRLISGRITYSICLPVPENRKNYANLSIELYYSDDDLKTLDPHTGKRLWFSNEIEIIMRPGTGEKIYRALDKSIIEEEFMKKVFDQPADQIINSKNVNVGLSKAAFTKMVTENDEVADKIDLSSFRLFFDALGMMLKEA